MTTHQLNIDLDQPCPQCGKPGSVNNGVCLECALKNLDRTSSSAPRRRQAKIMVIDERDDLIREYQELLEIRTEAMRLAEERAAILAAKLAQAEERSRFWEQSAKTGLPDLLCAYLDWRCSHPEAEK